MWVSARVSSVYPVALVLKYFNSILICVLSKRMHRICNNVLFLQQKRWNNSFIYISGRMGGAMGLWPHLILRVLHRILTEISFVSQLTPPNLVAFLHHCVASWLPQGNNPISYTLSLCSKGWFSGYLELSAILSVQILYMATKYILKLDYFSFRYLVISLFLRNLKGTMNTIRQQNSGVATRI